MGTAIPKNPELKLLVLINGAYGKRMVKIAEYYNIPYYTVVIIFLFFIFLDGMEGK